MAHLSLGKQNRLSPSRSSHDRDVFRLLFLLFPSFFLFFLGETRGTTGSIALNLREEGGGEGKVNDLNGDKSDTWFDQPWNARRHELTEKIREREGTEVEGAGERVCARAIV